MVDNGFLRGERLAVDWIAGRSELCDDLAELIEGMPRPFGEDERGFLTTVAAAARQASKRKAEPAETEAPAPTAAPREAPTPAFDVDASWRRARERERQARLEEFARVNQEAWNQQRALLLGAPVRKGWGWW